MASSSPLLRVLREAGDRPVLVADGHPVSGAELLAGNVPPGGLPEAMAARVATQLAFPAWEKDPHDQRLRYWAGILGPPPIRHTVLYPACELTVDLALATLLTGGTVRCGEREQRADELLADLARSRTTHLSLPSQRLWQVSRLPGRPVAALAELRRVLHIGPEPRQDDVFAAVEALGAVVAHVREPSSDAEAADRALRQVVEAAGALAWKRAIGVTGEQVRTFLERFHDAVLSSMLLALRCGDTADDPAHGRTLAEILAGAQVAPGYRPLAGRWLRVLVETGLIARHGDRFLALRPITAADVREAWASAAEAWTGHLGSATAVDYLRQSAERLPGLLTGEQQAASLFLPAGSHRVADALERGTAAGRYLGAALGTAVRQIAAAHCGPGPLRVLEVGAGIGVNTGAVTRALAAEGGPGTVVDYLCTEASDLLLDAARARTGTRPRVRFALFDVHDDPSRQGFRPHSFDVVIGADVLAAAHAPEGAARSLAELLTPGGWLLLTEPTREPYEFLVSRAFLPWTDPRDARLDPDTDAPSPHRWRAALTGAGAGTILTLPEDDHPLARLGRRLFAARVR